MSGVQGLFVVGALLIRQLDYFFLYRVGVGLAMRLVVAVVHWW